MLITPPELSAPEALDVMLQGAAKTAVTVLRIVHGPDTALVQAEVAGETTPGETVATTLRSAWWLLVSDWITHQPEP